MKTAMSGYGRALRQAAGGQAAPLYLTSPGGDTIAHMDAAHWCSGTRPGDESMLDICGGPTLDVGCGPGRLVAALGKRGIPALGIDISEEAVAQARSIGAAALLCDVFSPVPDEGKWKHILLADGNIGIGGDPARLLRRCADLLGPQATVAVELGAPGSGSWRRPVRLRHAGWHSPVFWWAAVAAEDLRPIADSAGLSVLHSWSQAGRWFATVGGAG